MKILVVEDEPDLEFLINRKFRDKIRAGELQFLFAQNGLEALEKLQTNPDIYVVLSDIKMPQMDGLTLLIELNERYPLLHTIIISAYGDMKNIRTAMNRGIYDFLTKPIDFDDLELTLNKTIRHVHQVIHNMTEHRKAEEQLLRLKKAVETMQLGVTITDLEGKIIYTNPAEARIHGYQVEELLGKDVGILAPSELRNPMPLEQIEQWKGLKRESVNIRKDGSTFPVWLMSEIVKNAEGQPTAIVTSCEDITERKRAEMALIRSHADLLAANERLKATQAQLVQSAKLASIGELATGIAHELNQPLMYIRSSAQLAMMDNPENLDPQKVLKVLKRVEEGTARMMKIITQLRNFARQTDVDFKPLKLHDILENSMILVNEQFKLHNIRLEKRFASNLPPVLGNSQQLEQVFINLLNNARDALKGRKDPGLMIQTAIRSQKDGSGQVAVSFSDNGCGISQRHLEKIFDPFFTTKEEGKGTGLGLSISYGIIRNHRGQIQISSVEGEGTTFTITLPVMEESKITIRSETL
jgi:PAS domain S-box-containing protein